MGSFRYVTLILLFSVEVILGGNTHPAEKKKTFTIHINQTDVSIRAEVLSDNSSVKVKPDEENTYCWYAANKIMQTKGGFDGRLLHGEYSSFFTNNNLKEKGRYEKGLKTGKWITWYSNGKIMEVNFWRNGKKNGRYVLFNEYGDKMAEAKFKNDKLHGTFYTYQKDKVVSEKKYKNGDEFIKPGKSTSEKPEKKEIRESNDGNEKVSPAEKIKKYFSKSEKDKRKAERLQKKTTEKLKREEKK